MGRHPQPEIRQRLLDACADYALTHGLPDRLEPLARAAGTSARMLIYHFGTRDKLQRAVLQQARRRQVALFTELLQVRDGEPYPRTLRRAWTGFTSADSLPYLRMFGRSPATAERLLEPDFRRTATTDWLPPLTEGLLTVGRPELATLALAVIRGLLLDLEATGDHQRTDAAFDEFVALV